MPFDPTFLGGPLTVGASLGAAAIQRNWALKDWHRQNEYNLPINQVKRNRDAGLPLAAMFSQGGSTSTDVRSSEVDPTLGVAQGIQQYQQNRLLRKQLQMLDEEIGIKEAEKVIAQVAANKAMDEDRYYHQNKGKEIEPGLIQVEVGNRREDSLAMSMREQEAQTQTKEITASLQSIINETQKELAEKGYLTADFISKLKHTIHTNKLLNLQFKSAERMNEIDQQLFDQLKDAGKTTNIEALMHKIFYRNVLKDRG